MKYYDKLVFELSKEGRVGYSLPANRFPAAPEIPAALRREASLDLPEVSEPDVVRHYTNLSQMNFGVDTGFYPLGSCTMKYNPKINEEVAALPGFAGLHPLEHAGLTKGALKVYQDMDKFLAAITGMHAFTFDPCAGAHGELTGLMIMRQYHMMRGDLKRTKVIVPDSAHGTNPASAAVCGLEVVEVKSLENGRVDVEALKPLLDDTVAGMMMTNPNTLGLFETQIKEIAELVHGVGGLMYYDGANMNPLMGVLRHHAPEPAQDLLDAARRRRPGQRPGGCRRAPGGLPARHPGLRLPRQLRRHPARLRVYIDVGQAEPEEGGPVLGAERELHQGMPEGRVQAPDRGRVQARVRLRRPHRRRGP